MAEYIPRMEIALSSCVLRRLRWDDAASIARHADNPRVWRNMLDNFAHPYSIEDGRRWIGSTIEDDPPLNLAIVVGGEAAGATGVIPGTDVHRGSMEIGYWLGEKHWNRGIATEALIAMTEYAFSTFPVQRLWAGVFGWNAASARVLEKAGYHLEARQEAAITKDGETTDELIYVRLRR